jgi:hypothetical protein
LLGKIPTTREIPRRGTTHTRLTSNQTNFIVNSIEDLIETTFQEVLMPLNHIPPIPLEYEHNFDGENPKIDMGELNTRE